MNNAGATFKAPVKGPDGFELTFALNRLAYFQFTTSLLDLIRKTPGARRFDLERNARARGTRSPENAEVARGLGYARLFDLEAGERPLHEGTSAASFGYHGNGELRSAPRLQLAPREGLEEVLADHIDRGRFGLCRLSHASLSGLRRRRRRSPPC